MSLNKQALIIGADPDIGNELRSVLERLDFQVTIVDDPSQVSESMNNGGYEVACISVALADGGWRRTLRALRESDACGPVILMLRSPDEQEIRHALNTGTYVAIDRPISEDQLTGLMKLHDDGLFVGLRG